MTGTSNVVEVDFKSYVRDVVPNEWWPDWWESAAHQAGALAVKGYAWFNVMNWRPWYTINGQCYHVWSDARDQVYIPNTRDIPHDFAVEQTWNYSLHNDGAIYPTFYKAGCPVNTPGIFTNCQGQTDACGQWYLGVPSAPDPAPGDDMSQYGSQACALDHLRWSQIANKYYFDEPGIPGGHTYAQWHAAMGTGPPGWGVVTVKAGTWKWPDGLTIAYGRPSDMKVIGDWDGNGSFTQGVVRIQNGALWWYLANSRSSATADITPFAYGATGDVPVVGDWNGDGVWTIGVVRGRNWFLRNQNWAGGSHHIYPYGSAADTPVSGMWAPGCPVTTAAMIRLSGQNLLWLEDYYHSAGSAEWQFGYGRYTDRPTAGGWTGGCRSGPGVVRDEPPGYPSGLQRWLLRTCSCAGDADISFLWETIRP